MGSSYTLTEQTQQWIDSSKLSLTTYPISTVMVESAVEMIFSRVSMMFNTTLWNSAPNPLVVDTQTPGLIQKAMSLLIASWIYERAYANMVEGENHYAVKLESMAEAVVLSILEGHVILQDANQPNGAVVSPQTPTAFMPNDTTNAQPVYDSEGALVVKAGDNDIKFRMGATY